MSLWIIGLIYVLLGLLEVAAVAQNIAAVNNPVVHECCWMELPPQQIDLDTCYQDPNEHLDGPAGCVICVDNRFAVEWGVIAFVLNYIPLIGPFIATMLPTAVAMTQFETWQAVLGVFVSLNIIQFIVGNMLELRISGRKLSISPSVVLFSGVVLDLSLGPVRAFIGVPIVICYITLCERHPSIRWVANLLAIGPDNRRSHRPVDRGSR